MRRSCREKYIEFPGFILSFLDFNTISNFKYLADHDMFELRHCPVFLTKLEKTRNFDLIFSQLDFSKNEHILVHSLKFINCRLSSYHLSHIGAYLVENWPRKAYLEKKTLFVLHPAVL